MIASVLALALSLGNGGEDEAVLSPLCAVAVAELEGRLKAGVRAEDCQPAFGIAAAWIALEYYSVSGGSVEGISSFSVGDFSLSQNSTTGNSGYRAQAEALMRPYLVLSDFAFRGVKG